MVFCQRTLQRKVRAAEKIIEASFLSFRETDTTYLTHKPLQIAGTLILRVFSYIIMSPVLRQ